MSTERPAATPPESNEAERVDPATLYGEWRYDYITAGAIAQHMVFRFEPDGTLELESSSMDSLTEPPTMATDSGRFEITDSGAVRFSLEKDDGFAWEHSLTVVENAALIARHDCCRVINGATRFWTFRGYLATNDEGTRFERVHGRPPSGGVAASIHTLTELTFSAPIDTLGTAETCSFELYIDVTVEGAEGEEVRALDETFGCRVTADGDARLITVPELEPTDAATALERRHRATASWQQHIDEREDLRTWSEEARGAVKRAFEPQVYQDPSHPTVLFHSLDANTFEVTGLARVEP